MYRNGIIKLRKHYGNITETLRKHYENVAKTLRKRCENMVKIFQFLNEKSNLLQQRKISYFFQEVPRNSVIKKVQHSD